MDVRQLRCFLAVVDAGSISAAADALHLAQPSLSQTIATFERSLGTPLFHRIGRRLVLTDAGRRLIGPARQVLRDVEEARLSVRDLTDGRAGRLDLITMPSPGIEPLASLLRAVHRRFPAITYNVAPAFTPDEVLAAVRGGESEIGLLGAPAPISATDLAVQALSEQHFVLVTMSDPRTAGPGDVDLAELAGARLIAPRDASLMRSLIDEVVDRAGARIVAEVAHRSSVLPLVLAGLGDTILPSAWVPAVRQAGATARPIFPDRRLHVAAVSRKSHRTPAAELAMRTAAALAARSPGEAGTA
ncbi:LysR family transcriptional regulator [Prauserella endophytica]|uniref:LysR family transcriptional regulator n=1 Tax=Prauserella endophytica TaxID=1592324 RepID=A0ABY2RU59_9PSEU|nr:LysR family transcriptional regulator [Prauserella endophytica]PXY18099.1 LysR family transcriptional regulator [Prauserella coralliicola]TKG60631.1 LysR family transcriptional regulator [Prauserella endophytica]